MFDDECKQLRWFVLPSEAAACIHGNHTPSSSPLPFCPPSFREHLGLPPFETNCVEADVLDGDMKDNNYFGDKRNMTFENQINGEHHSVSSNTDICSTQPCVNSNSSASCSISNLLNNSTDSRNSTCRTSNCAKESPGYGGDFSNDAAESTNNQQKVDSIDSGSSEGMCTTNINKDVICDIKSIKDRKDDSKTRKRTGEQSEGAESDEILSKKVKEEKAVNMAAGKRKTGLKWYSPPKTIFAPFLKVLHLLINTEWIAKHSRKWINYSYILFQISIFYNLTGIYTCTLLSVLVKGR